MTVPRSNHRRAWPAVLAGAIVALVLVGCGGDDDGSSTTPSTLPGAGAAAGTIIDIVNSGATWKYEPQTATVPVGKAVTWTNSTDVPHNVVFSNAAVKSSDLFAKGKSFTATFPTPGAFPYVCSVHPDMTATVVVQ